MYSWIRLQPAGLEDLIAKTGFPASRVLSVLTGLELKGLIREVQKNHYVRTDLKITDSFSVPVFAQVAANPSTEKAYLVVGFTLQP